MAIKSPPGMPEGWKDWEIKYLFYYSIQQSFWYVTVYRNQVNSKQQRCE
jgi:hypothetical protein